MKSITLVLTDPIDLAIIKRGLDSYYIANNPEQDERREKLIAKMDDKLRKLGLRQKT